MSTAEHGRTACSITADDGSSPGMYFTDGDRLVRLLGSGEVRHGFVWIEDCATLDVLFLRASDLRDGALSPVCPRSIARVAARRAVP
jgi:hypothetical protein